MSYKKQIKNSIYEVPGEEIAELLSMEDAVRVYTALGFIRPGLASWGDEVIYISPEVCDQMAYTLKGKPMTLEHPRGLITAENRDKYMIGAVTEVIYNDTGSYDAKYFIDPKTRDGEEAIDACGWDGENPPRIKHVSCVYQVERWGDGGTLNGVKYDREVLAATMLQLALTENPRYDGTLIVYNSKDQMDIVEYINEEGGLDSQIKNSYTDDNKPKGVTMFGIKSKKEQVEVDMSIQLETKAGLKSIEELVQIANSAYEKEEEDKVKNADEKEKEDKVENSCGKDKVKNSDGIDGVPSTDVEQPDEAAGKPTDKVENADDEEDDEKKDKEDKDQPKNSASDLDAQENVLNHQIYNSAEPQAVESNVFEMMARAQADFRQE